MKCVCTICFFFFNHPASLGLILVHYLWKLLFPNNLPLWSSILPAFKISLSIDQQKDLVYNLPPSYYYLSLSIWYLSPTDVKNSFFFSNH